jgi:zinc protease
MVPLLLPFVWAAAAAPVVWPFAGVERTLLDNGLTVLVAPDHSSPLVSVAVMYTVGARNEAAGTTGLAHYVEHMNFRATRRFPGGEITEAITRMGGRWNGYTWIDQTYYAETVHRDALDTVLDLERDRMLDALYEADDFSRERTSVIAELHSYDDPRSVLYDAVLASSFEIHPYRHNTIGWLTDVEAVSRDEAYRFYRRFYHPNNAVLVVVGDVEPADALARVRARFEAVPRAGETTRVRTVEPPQQGERRVVVRRPGPHARVLAAFRAPALTEADFAAMVLFDALLAGGKGFRFTRDYPRDDAAPLHRAVAAVTPEATAHSQWQASRDPYVYTLGADVPEATALAAAEEALFRAAEQAAARAWTDEELARARRQVLTGWASDLDDKAGRAHQLAFFEVAGGYGYVVDMPARLLRVTRDDLRRFAGERLTRDRATVGWFVPTPATAPATATSPPAGPSPAPTAATAATASSLPSASAAAAGRPAPSPRSRRLRNGLTTMVAPGAGGALVALRGRIEAGALFDGGRPGLSALATELLARPVPGEPAPVAPLTWTLHEEPESPAVQRWIEFDASALAADVPDLLRDLAARLRRALAFAEGGPIEAAEWQAIQKAAAHRARTNAAAIATALWQRALTELFATSSPLRRPPWGEPASIEAAAPDALRAFVRSHLRPGLTTVVLAGGLEAAAADAELERRLGTLGTAPVDRPVAPSLAGAKGGDQWGVVRLPRPGKSQDDIRVVVPGDRARPWDAPATELLLYLLGETGYAGRLGKALVDPGLVYSVYASRQEDGAPGFLMVRTAAAPKDTGEVLRRIRSILEDAARGAFTPEELEEARAYVRGKRARAREGSAAHARDLLERPGPGTESAAAAVTLGQLNDTARRLFRNGAPLAIVAGPPSG